jgi:hypothetical protein
MGRRRELNEIDRYNATRTNNRTRHSQRSLNDHARRQVSEYTRLEKRPLARGKSSSSSLTGLAWLIIAGCILVVLAILLVVVVLR